MTRRTTTVLITAIVALIAFAAAVLLYQRHTRQQAAEQAGAQQSVMVRAHSPVLGPANAPVTIVEFFDPACEACRAFHPYVKQILAAHPRDVRLVVRYTPFHQQASVVGVRILEAARAQGRFEPVLQALMDGQPVWANHGTPDPDRAWEFARAAGLDLERARAHVATGAADALLQKDMADVQAVGVRATPTFFVNGAPLREVDPRVLAEQVNAAVAGVRR
ncbi:thioredoxin domain-containing protein [Pseudorhodoferax sp. Leaf267]|jgi:protein-disulfide isomerase|uniref:DsbA family protein n=1 Tax=Pseudorhodoferax sp. Leaf267 TaxID=1736316 RepID=UPI0006F6762B|nr:thioredoxin domain-containing protein [Pseudorhodoferax sp. Leaf267]KQP14809.1 disulfide bond formation protein DsbA [Pseudorhodoferax sp. Leaf267]